MKNLTVQKGSSRSSLKTLKKHSVSVKVTVKKRRSSSRVSKLGNGNAFSIHIGRVQQALNKPQSNYDLHTRMKRVASPTTFIIPTKISATTYESVRFKNINYSIANKLPQVLKQAYNNDLVVSNGIIYGFEKKRGVIENSKVVDFSKADVTFSLKANVVTLTNYINNSQGKIYRMAFKTKSSANLWMKEVVGIGIYKQVVNVTYQKQ